MKTKEDSSPSVTSANLDHTKPCWYWNKEDLVHTPSQLEGLAPATEVEYRREGAKFIFDLGVHLGLHYDTLATGITYFHRFYMFHSFKQFPRYVTGTCCLFLAGKVEETPKKCRDIIKTAHSLLNDVEFGQFGDDPKKEVMVLEKILLQTIKFDLQVEHPYQFLLKYAKQLKGEKKKIQKLVQMAWTFINDSLCTTVSLQWEPEIIAVSVMYLAGRFCKYEIQEWTSKPTYRRWWEQFVQDVPINVLEDICCQILDLYSQGEKQVPHLQQPSSLQSTPQVPSVQELQQSHSSELSQSQQKESQKTAQQQTQSKKPSPQLSLPRQVKRSVAVSPKEFKTAEPPSKIPQIETTHPPILPVHPPPECKPMLPAVASMGESEQTGTVEAGDQPKVQIPPSYPASVYQPPLPHCPSQPPPSRYITGMSTANSYMSREHCQILQSMMKTEGPAQGVLPPAHGRAQGVLPPAHGRAQGVLPPAHGRAQGVLPPAHGRAQGVLPPAHGPAQGVLPPAHGPAQGVLPPAHGPAQGVLPPAHGPAPHLPFHPHVYLSNPQLPFPPPPELFLPPNISPWTPGYPPPVTYNLNFSSPQLPPTPAVPPCPPPGLEMLPVSYSPLAVPQRWVASSATSYPPTWQAAWMRK